MSGIYRKRNLADNEALFSQCTEAYAGEVASSLFGVAICADYSVDNEFVAASKAGAVVVFHPSAPGLYGPRKTDDYSWRAGFDWWRGSCIEEHGTRAKNLGDQHRRMHSGRIHDRRRLPGLGSIVRTRWKDCCRAS